MEIRERKTQGEYKAERVLNRENDEEKQFEKLMKNALQGYPSINPGVVNIWELYEGKSIKQPSGQSLAGFSS